jgi:DNA adenine methylase
MRSPLSYVGGKNRFVSIILPLIPEHTTYVEPFAGGAQIFFHKPASKVEVLNDLDGELVNFYRICQSHHEELIRYMRFMLLSREWFIRLHKTPPETLTDIQRAARYFYLQKSAYGGRVARQNYAIHVVQRPNFSPARLHELIETAHERLSRVQIERLPYEEVVARYDRAATFFYLDPPYYDIRLYRHNLEHDDFVRMAEHLKGIKGKFLLSINDRPEVRQIFSAFSIIPITVSYSLHRRAGKHNTELLIKNY